LAVINVIRAAGALTVAAIIGYIGVSVRRERKASPPDAARHDHAADLPPSLA
jgi:hypothetical protein